jgi:hypothetical protein
VAILDDRAMEAVYEWIKPEAACAAGRVDVFLSVARRPRVTSVTWFKHGIFEESENVGNVLSVNVWLHWLDLQDADLNA